MPTSSHNLSEAIITAIDQNGKETKIKADIIKIAFPNQKILMLTLADIQKAQISVVAHTLEANAEASLIIYPERPESALVSVETHYHAKLTLTVQYNDEITTSTRKTLPSKIKIKRWLTAALFESMEVTVRFVGEQEGMSLNHTHRKKPKATNVLTFNYGYTPEGYLHCDIVLCCPVVELEAQQQGKKLADHYAHLLIHGLLHAQGYDHETSEEDQKKMETLEIDILQQLGIDNPYE